MMNCVPRFVSRALAGAAISAIAVFATVSMAPAAQASSVGGESATANTQATYTVEVTTLNGPERYELGVDAEGNIVVVHVPASGGSPDAGQPNSDGPETKRLSWSHTFSKTQTEIIFNAAVTGATAVITGLCTVVAPGWLLDIGCAVVGGIIADVVRRLGAPNGRCLRVKISTRFGWPPITASGSGYVSC